MSLTPTQVRAINMQYLGTEPNPATLQNGNHFKAYTWYSAFCDYNDAKEYLITFLEEKERIAEVNIIKKIPLYSFPLTLGWLARMQSRNVILNDVAKTYFEDRLALVLEISPVSEITSENETTKSTPNVQDFIREKFSNLIGDIDKNIIDDELKIDLYDYLLKQEFPSRYASKLVDYYMPELQEFRDALSGDEEILEGYQGYTRPQLKAMERLYTSIVEDARRYSDTQKKARKPYKKRALKMDKILKTFKCQKECPEYKLASIDPSKIIGAEEVWLFNTKYLTLTVLRAIDKGGLKVKGTSILNYNEKNSVTKKIGRKTDEILKQLLDGGKRIANKLMDSVKATELEANNRSGKDTIIVKVI